MIKEIKEIKRTACQAASINSDFYIFRDKYLGAVLFGSPPDIVKYFGKKGEPVPANIVIPRRTYRAGINHFDLEFVVYSVIFSKENRYPINIICTENQEDRIRAMLQETLFGPLLKNIFRSFLSAAMHMHHLNIHKKRLLTEIIERIGCDHNIFSQFKETLAAFRDKTRVISKMRHVLRSSVKEISLFNGFRDARICHIIAKAYVKAAMLKQEMDVFSLCREEDEQHGYIDKILHFQRFDSDGKATILGKDGDKLKIWQTMSGAFKLYKKGKLIDHFELQLDDDSNGSHHIASAPLEIPELGITFLGSGTGFDPETNTSSFIIWINGKGIAIDMLANCDRHFKRFGIASCDVRHVFLSHLHADHDAGILEMIMMGERIYLLTSQPIFDSFLRKAEALTRFTGDSINDFVYFVDIDKGKEVPIPGIKRAYITFDYSLHCIPTGRFKLRYKGGDGKEVKIGFSGDTKYDRKLVNKLYSDGIITAERRDKILGFLWDCDLIIHEAGGGAIHTDVKDLSMLQTKVKKNIILTHIGQKDRNFEGFRFGIEGHTIPLVKQKCDTSVKDFAALLKNTGLFFRTTTRGFEHLFRNATFETFSIGQYVLKEGDTGGHKFYIILSGFAEIIKGDKVVSIYQKGDFFGGHGLINRSHERNASVMAKSRLQLIRLDRSPYQRFQLSATLHERIYKLSNYFTNSTLSSLIGYISRGEFMTFEKGTNVIISGDTGGDVYILLSGEVDIIDPEGRQIGYIAGVDVFGEISHLKHIPIPATVRVSTTQATAVRLDVVLFSEINRRFPSFYGTVIKNMEKRWRDLGA